MRFDFVANQRPYRSNLLLVVVAAVLLDCRSSAAEPVAVPLAPSSLPSGDGIAAEVLGTKQRQQHPAFIFSDDFESGGIGDQWDETRNPNGNTLSLVSLKDDTAPIGSRSLKVTAHLGKDTGGGMTKWFPSAPDVFVRFYVRFAPDSDYIHHFVTLRANRGLTGGDRWSGFGGAGNRPPGDQRFSTALEPWGNWSKWPAPGRWNFYSYWHQMKASPDGRYWGNGFRPETQPNISKDQWICCEFMLRHNTPGQADGEQAYWIDGELRGHWKGFNWRTDQALQANALTLESYVTDRWTKNPINVVYFDNLVIASQYIGPEKPR
ncbi:hypothetical protein Enr13x_48990 [Stieleria neptunia]|uniref:GH16 domain-containing protein n=1 Tax=Stieleria neptunia TaxID=2527979 RepID=A0A518HVZ7_9BACT|nr:hypothetical protein [Stieleria neptunia]QDV45026.1 hypothetical protein Enr13x_48990 [Stieleria neptunia]